MEQAREANTDVSGYMSVKARYRYLYLAHNGCVGGMGWDGMSIVTRGALHVCMDGHYARKEHRN